jgi:hypothetical protein
MKQDQLNQRLQSYSAWRDNLITTVEDYQAWLEEHGVASPEQEFRIFEAIEALRKDRLTLAFVAEFSRGKTELINALFFAHYGRRLLPSEAGRTTMCPTELFYDSDSKSAYIHLLPIETRLHEQSIADFKHEPIHWTQIPLDVDDVEQVTQALHEVIKTKQVPVQRARELGLYDENTDPYFRAHGSTPAQVEIPHWRHALISFPHEFLKQGLVILDTPGLNAMGNEPEMWQHHVRTVRDQSDNNLVVVLNKIDTLWDELKDSSRINASIESQRRATAEQLQVDVERVFPISAQKGLLAKVRNDANLLRQSRLDELESFVAGTVLPRKQDIVRTTLWHKSMG